MGTQLFRFVEVRAPRQVRTYEAIPVTTLHPRSRLVEALKVARTDADRPREAMLRIARKFLEEHTLPHPEEPDWAPFFLVYQKITDDRQPTATEVQERIAGGFGRESDQLAGSSAFLARVGLAADGLVAVNVVGGLPLAIPPLLQILRVSRRTRGTLSP